MTSRAPSSFENFLRTHDPVAQPSRRELDALEARILGALERPAPLKIEAEKGGAPVWGTRALRFRLGGAVGVACLALLLFGVRGADTPVQKTASLDPAQAQGEAYAPTQTQLAFNDETLLQTLILSSYAETDTDYVDEE